MMYFIINLTKEMKDLYTENYKTLNKNWKKTQIKWNIIHVHELEELMLLKYPYNPQWPRNSMKYLIFQWYFSQK